MPGKVERRNRGTHTHRLADHDLVDARGDIFHDLALAHHRHAAGDFHILVGADHFCFGFFEGFAAFIRDQSVRFHHHSRAANRAV